MKETLDSILDTMDVPKGRRNDLQWLLRNLAIRNGQHPRYAEAVLLIKKLLRSRGG